METVHPARVINVIVAFRGTASATNVKTDVDSAQLPYPGVLKNGEIRDVSERQRQWMEKNGKIYVHQGFYGALLSLWDPTSSGCRVPEGGTLYQQVKGLVDEQTNTWGTPPKLTVCGHSLGGALATLFSVEIALDGHFHHVPLRCMTFGQPRVMNVSGSKFINEIIPHYWRVVNEGDPIPTIPKSLAARAEGVCVIPHIYILGRRYKHAGREVMMKESGMMVLPNSPLEGDGVPNPNQHFMIVYERSLELFLMFRRQWLWKKATNVVKSVVRIRLRTEHDLEAIDIPELGHHQQQSIPPYNPNSKEECIRWKRDGYCTSFATRGRCCFIHKPRGGSSIPSMGQNPLVAKDDNDDLSLFTSDPSTCQSSCGSQSGAEPTRFASAGSKGMKGCGAKGAPSEQDEDLPKPDSCCGSNNVRMI
jgi:hypothetical protein